jgi:DNA-binding winged helix-turn-helix (wHTH) protein
MTRQPLVHYRFGDQELDVGQRKLRRGDRVVKLQPKVFALLQFLILHRARVVPKEVLLRELWPDAYVTAASLTRLVKEARRAVGDDGREQRVIQTLYGYGYRFIAEVEPTPDVAASEVERAIDLARCSLEAALEMGPRDLRARVRDYAETCLLAVHAAQRQSG